MDYSPELASSYADYKAQASRWLEDVAIQLKKFRDRGGRLHRGAKVLLEFNWDELLPLSTKPANFGSYEARVEFQNDPLPLVSSQRQLRKVSEVDSMKANRIAMNKNYKQSLYILYRKSTKALRKVQRLETERRLYRTGIKSATESSVSIKIGKRRKTKAKVILEKKALRGAGIHGEMRLSPKDLRKNLARDLQGQGLPLTNREHDAIILWTRNRLRELIHPIEEEKRATEAYGRVKPLIFRQYATKRNVASKLRRMSMFPAQAVAPKVKVQRVKMPKFLLALPDGNLFIYYPSGHIAFCQIAHHLGHRRIYSFLFDDSPRHSMLASFTDDGQGCVYYTNRRSCPMAMFVNSEGGTLRDVKGYVTHHWRWSSTDQQLKSLDLKINDQLRLQIDNTGAMKFVFNCLDNSLTIPLWSYASILQRHKHTDQGGKEEHTFTAAASLKRRFQQTMQQYFRALLIGAGALPPDHVTKPMAKSALVKSPTPPHVTGATVTDSLKKKVILQAAESVHKDIAEPEAESGETAKAEQEAESGETAKEELEAESGQTGSAEPEAESGQTGSTEPEAETGHKAPEEPSTVDHPKEPPSLHLGSKWITRSSSVGLLRHHGGLHRYSKSPLHLRCPAALRRWLSGCREGLDCRCFNKMPFLTDFDFDTFLEGRRSGPPQVLVLVVVSSQYPALSAKIEGITQKMYRMEQRGRPSPCVQCTHDTYRLVMYDVHSPLMASPPLLIERNCAMPGMVLMYRGGKLLFGGTVFNGYGSSEKHLLQQIAHAHHSYTTTHFLPDNYKFSTPCLYVPLSDTLEDSAVKCPRNVEVPENRKPLKGPAADICTRARSSPSSLRFLMNNLPKGECLVSTNAAENIDVTSSLTLERYPSGVEIELPPDSAHKSTSN